MASAITPRPKMRQPKPIMAFSAVMTLAPFHCERGQGAEQEARYLRREKKHHVGRASRAKLEAVVRPR
jgi:hypothetical protein